MIFYFNFSAYSNSVFGCPFYFFMLSSRYPLPFTAGGASHACYRRVWVFPFGYVSDVSLYILHTADTQTECAGVGPNPHTSLTHKQGIAVRG
jgi:hypothetical protein